jgi:integrase
MRVDEIDWRQNRLVLAAERMKSRRPMVVYLNAPAMAALRSIRTDRELVFPWPHARRDFYKYLHRLEDSAGIPEAEQFGMHTIRKTVATLLYEVNPGAAQFALGHTTNDVTRQHYVDGGPMVARALDQLPQPEAFPTGQEPPEDNAAA